MRPAIRIEFRPLGNLAANDEILSAAVIAPSHGGVGRHIVLDPRTDRHMGRLLLHELTHVRHPSWSETRVTREAARRWKRLSWKQKARIYQLLGSAKIEGDKE